MTNVEAWRLKGERYWLRETRFSCNHRSFGDRDVCPKCGNKEKVVKNNAQPVEKSYLGQRER